MQVLKSSILMCFQSCVSQKQIHSSCTCIQTPFKNDRCSMRKDSCIQLFTFICIVIFKHNMLFDYTACIPFMTLVCCFWFFQNGVWLLTVLFLCLSPSKDSKWVVCFFCLYIVVRRLVLMQRQRLCEVHFKRCKATCGMACNMQDSINCRWWHVLSKTGFHFTFCVVTLAPRCSVTQWLTAAVPVQRWDQSWRRWVAKQEGWSHTLMKTWYSERTIYYLGNMNIYLRLFALPHVRVSKTMNNAWGCIHSCGLRVLLLAIS